MNISTAGPRFSVGRLPFTRRRAATLALLGCLIAASPTGASSSDRTGAASGEPTPSELRESVAFLTRSAWNGRAPGSAGADSVAREIERRFRSWGLEGTGPGGSLTVLTTVETGVRTQGAIGLRDEKHGYRFARDYRPLGFSGDGRVLSTLTFVGYGRSGGTMPDDFAGIDLRGKVALMLAGSGPPSGAVPPAYPDGTQTPYAAARRAKEHGAAAVLLADAKAASAAPEPLWGLSPTRGYVNLGLPVVQVTRSAADSLLSAARLDLNELQRALDASAAPRSLDLQQDSVEVLVEARRLEGALASVVGWRRGRTPETVVIAACYDGYGMVAARPGEQPLPGANDNASGTAVLLALARALATGPTPERSLCFIAYAGCDLAGIGLTTGLSQPGLEPASLVGLLDLASLGRPTRHGLLCVGAVEGAEGVLRRANDRLPVPLPLRMEPEASRESVPGRLQARGIPAIGISFGRSADSGELGDRAETLDLDAMTRACRLALELVADLAGAQATEER